MGNKGTDSQLAEHTSLVRGFEGKLALDEATALYELIKNAYDADAEWVKIEIDTINAATLEKLHFKASSKGFITIEDDGIGMSWEDVQGKWMNFSLSGEQKLKDETRKKRIPVGGKGIGRMSSARLGNCVELFTTTSQHDKTNHVAINWDQLIEGRVAVNVPLFSEQLDSTDSKRTMLYIFPLIDLDFWNGNSYEEAILSLKSKVLPFVDKSFNISVKLNGVEIFDRKEGQKEIRKNEVTIENAWQKMSPDLIQEVIAFWNNNKMIKPGFSSEERARQVVLILRDANTKAIVGLSTAGVVTFKQLNSNNFYLYRSIILPDYRHPGLTSKVIVETRDLLEAYNKKEGNNFCKGILTFVENPRLQQFRREAVWPASKMAYIGMDKEGRHIRVYYFKGATI